MKTQEKIGCSPFGDGVWIKVERQPERRIFYIDLRDASPQKADAFITALKKRFNKTRKPR